MNIVLKDQQQTMTSLEISEATGKEHGHVKRDISKMLTTIYDILGDKDASSFGYIYMDSQNRSQTAYRLPYDETICLLTGYDAKSRMAVIKRWQELEGAKPKALDLNDPQALRAALLGYTEKVLQLETKVAADAPKVAFAEVIRAMDGVCHIGEFCKTMRIGRNRMFKRMKEDKILMASRMPYQKYIDKGYFSVIEQTPYTNSKGETHTTFTTMVTGAGQVFLARRYADMIGVEK